MLDGFVLAARRYLNQSLLFEKSCWSHTFQRRYILKQYEQVDFMSAYACVHVYVYINIYTHARGSVSMSMSVPFYTRI